jgi:tRNA (cmo5U34)-methyltransferase
MTSDAATTPLARAFADAAAVANYADGPRRMVPGYDSLLVMSEILLSEHMPTNGHALILGAGGGLEMTHFAQHHPDWRFVGVDPSAPMLALAQKTMGAMADQADMICGHIGDAPRGPFDAATCILTLHFVPVADRLATLTAVRARLKPGAPFICAHFSVPGDAAERAVWFGRYAAFAERSGMPHDKIQAGAKKIAAELPILSPSEDEALLVQAGFGNLRQFYAGFTFRGWVCETA